MKNILRNRKAKQAANRDQRQPISLRHVPKAQPAAGQDTRAVGLPEVFPTCGRSLSSRPTRPAADYTSRRSAEDRAG